MCGLSSATYPEQTASIASLTSSIQFDHAPLVPEVFEGAQRDPNSSRKDSAAVAIFELCVGSKVGILPFLSPGSVPSRYPVYRRWYKECCLPLFPERFLFRRGGILVDANSAGRETR
jgi:hypothetical protein